MVLKGNPISYEVEYRPTIFRILPGLKNLDVIMMKRVPKSICKKDKPDEDDDFEGRGTVGIQGSMGSADPIIFREGFSSPSIFSERFSNSSTFEEIQ